MDVYGVAGTNDISVADNLDIYGDSLHCNISFIRVAEDCEVDAFSEFFTLLDSTITRRGEEKVKTRFSGLHLKEECSVSFFYSTLIPQDNDPIHWNNIWQIKVISRAVFFALTSSLGKILTMNLRKRHYVD